MKQCPHCGHGHALASEPTHCLRCGQSLAGATFNSGAMPPPLPAPGIRLNILAAILLSAGLLIVLVTYQSSAAKLRSEQTRLADELASLDQTHDAEVAAAVQAAADQKAQDELLHQQRLSDQKLLSGETARERHAEEWAKRLAHDPDLASTAMEKTLLRMQQLGRDPSVAPRAALQEVAAMALPPGSQVEVLDAGGAFNVRTAFKMSAVTANERGAVTKHNSTASMRREIEEISARLFQDLFDYCGSRGINSLTVSCNHTLRKSLVPQGATESERRQILNNAGLVMSSLYRVSLDSSRIATVGNWRALSIPQVIRLMKVDRDGLQSLTIEGFSNSSETQDAAMPLEF